MTKVQEGNFSRRNTSWANSWLLSRKKKWLMVSACHAGMLGDHRTPVGSARLLVEYNVTCYIIFYFYFIARSMLLVNSVPRLTLPIVAPPLPDVGGVCCKCQIAGQVVVRPLAHDRGLCWAVERDEGELRQVDLVNLMEDLLPLA